MDDVNPVPDYGPIRIEGQALAAASAAHGPFVDPDLVAESIRLLRRRGERWAERVLGRPLTRRSRAYPDLPWLETGELEALIIADHDPGVPG